MPYSPHRMLGISQYTPGGLVLGTDHGIKFDHDMFTQGRKPDVLVDYPIHMTGYETIDLFNWQDKARDMVSQIAFTQMVNVQSETIDRYIREGKIKPDLEVPVNEHRSFRFFEKTTVKEYARQYGWTLITRENMKSIFMKMVETMTMSYSYKPVFMLAFLVNLDESGCARLEDVARDFAGFYEDRRDKGLVVEKRPCIFTRDTGNRTDSVNASGEKKPTTTENSEGNPRYSLHEVERSDTEMPFKRFEDMHVMHHARQLGTLQFYKELFRQLTDEDYEHISKCCHEAIERYFSQVKDNP